MGINMNIKRNKVIFLALLGVGTLILFSLPQIDVSFNHPNSINDSEVRNDPRILKSSGYWNLTMPIEIDDAGTNNWTWAEGEAWFGGWMAEDPASFAPSHNGSAQRLPNGNTLSVNGTSAVIFELTPGGEVVWEYKVPGPASRSSGPRAESRQARGRQGGQEVQ